MKITIKREQRRTRSGLSSVSNLRDAVANTKYISAFILSAALLLTGCMKEDIDELRKQQEENAARITALEEWQASVNSQITTMQGLITALEGNDYVTGVTPVTEGGVTVGYTITFTKSSPITIYHGEKGDDGDDGHSPVIGVGEYPSGSGVYYWTVDGEWLKDGNGNMIRTTGADGTTPTVEIGTNGNWFINGTDTGVKATGEDGNDGATPRVTIGTDRYWYISADGTATGTAPGTGWTSTGVKATGADGTNGATPKVIIGTDGIWYISADGTATGTAPGTGWTSTGVKATGDKGDDGDSMFAGVDHTTSDDYVIITLNDGPPATTITLPKYKSIGISFTHPGLFGAGSTQTIVYTTTGTTAPTNVRVIDVPTGWKVSVNTTAKTFTVTAPATVTADNFEGEATILVLDNNSVAAVYELKVRAAGFYRVGDYYPDPCAIYESGTLVRGTAAVGVVYWLSNQGDGDHPYDKVSAHGKIVGLYEKEPAFWANTWAGSYGTTYNAGTGWAMTTPADIIYIYCGYNGMLYETWVARPVVGGPIVDSKPSDLTKHYGNRGWFNGKITDAGGKKIRDAWYWTSTQDGMNAQALHFNSGNLAFIVMTKYEYGTRAVKEF